MTYNELCITAGTISVLLIGWLMIVLRKEFKRIGLQSWIDDYQKEKKLVLTKLDIGYNELNYSNRQPVLKYELPKRRKWRDNKGEV